MGRIGWRSIGRWMAVGCVGFSLIGGPVSRAGEAAGPGQVPPPKTPELLLPGIVSTGMYERDVALSPDGKELYFGIIGGGAVSVIARTQFVDGHWTAAEVAPFSGMPMAMDLEMSFSPDGKRLYFLSTRPMPGKEPKPGWGYQDIWVMERTPGGWSEPVNLGAPVNSGEPEFYPSLTRNGTIYFTRGKEGEKGSAIWRSRLVDGKFAEPEKLPPQVNASPSVFNSFVAPDESYILTCVAGKKENLGEADYYVVFRTPDDKWSEPINLGPDFNNPKDAAVSISVSSDMKIIFFASSRRSPRPAGARWTYKALAEMRTAPGNGNSDIYWVDASVIEKFRPLGGPASN